ncbi:MAG: hypothetical protein WCE38_16640 [Burkholderiales bacterium]|jgi:hypothetical protein
MNGTSAIATGATARKLPLVLVQSDPEHGWRVLLPGVGKPQEFLNRAPALTYAKAWASAHRPSMMRVSGIGTFSHEWSFR